MCGRFVIAEVGDELVTMLRPDIVSSTLPDPSFNVAPTQDAIVVLDSVKTEPPTRRIERARWGLIPPWAKDARDGARAFNARSEELEDKRTFQVPFARQRAVVPAVGYYEWQQQGESKQPFFVTPAQQDPGVAEPMLMAGLYGWWRDPSKADDDASRWVLTFTVLTADAAGPLAELHPRMPVLLDADRAEAWLDPTEEYPREVLDAIVDTQDELIAGLELRPVSAAVGNVRNNSPELIAAVA